MKVQKEADGHYYEKIVTWKPNENKTSDSFGLAWCLLGLFFGFLAFYLSIDTQIKLIDITKSEIISMMLTFIFFSVFFFIFSYLENNHRSVVMRRIV